MCSRFSGVFLFKGRRILKLWNTTISGIIYSAPCLRFPCVFDQFIHARRPLTHAIDACHTERSSVETDLGRL